MTATAAESEWVVEDRVPIYDQHVWEDADPTTGKVHRVPVTKERLQKIANARNEQIARTGNMAPILVGHSRLDLPEYAKAKWSPTVGWADNFEVGDHPDDGRPTMYARHKFYPTAEVGGETMTAREIMRRFPHRSVESTWGGTPWTPSACSPPATRRCRSTACSAWRRPPTRPRPLRRLRWATAATNSFPPSWPSSNSSPAASRTPPTPRPRRPVRPAGPPQCRKAPARSSTPPAARPTPPTPEMEKVRMQRDQDAIRHPRHGGAAGRRPQGQRAVQAEVPAGPSGSGTSSSSRPKATTWTAPRSLIWSARPTRPCRRWTTPPTPRTWAASSGSTSGCPTGSSRPPASPRGAAGRQSSTARRTWTRPSSTCSGTPGCPGFDEALAAVKAK
jgi:hypothetical protein